MKMENEFNLPVSVGWLSNIFDELSTSQKQAAAHAINCHDEMVSVRDELMQELQNVLDHHSDDIGHLVRSSIKEALKRAESLK